jgi:hypothetical protein
LRNFNIIDIETFNDNGRFVPYCICIILNEKKISIYGSEVVKRLIETFEKLKVNETFYAHNLTFDGSIIIENMGVIGKLKGTFFRSNIYEIVIWTKDFKVVFKCSYKMFPLSLKKIGQLIKEKEKMDFPHEFAKKENLYYIGNKPNNVNVKEWNFKREAIDYCFNDCELTKKMLEKITESMNLQEKKIFLESRSISSLSLKTFKERFNIFNLETNMKIDKDEMIRNGFYGGRCEVFGNKYPNEKIFHFDFSGMYAEIMREEFFFNDIKIEKSHEISEGGFYKVDVFSDNMDIPVLPFKEKRDGKLIFPNGEWTGTYWYEELKLFEQEGGIIRKIHYKILLKNKEKIFKNFVENYNKLRNKSDIENVFWKLFINSIYGRLGMGPNFEETLLIQDEEEYKKIRKEKEILKESIINRIKIITIEKEKKVDKVDSNVSIAAQITSKARIKLFKAFKEVIKNEGRILYTDTDSIFAGFKKNVLGEKHGEVYWDGNKSDTVIDDAIFALPKGYALLIKKKEIVKIKGFKRNSISFSEFEKTFKNNDELTLKEVNFRKSNFSLKFEEIEKKIQLNSYDKRIFDKDKNNTKALVLKNE